MPEQILSREEFEKTEEAGSTQYDSYLAKKQDELAAQALAAAEKKAGDYVKVRVKAGPGTWRAGQSHMLIPCKAPIVDGKQNLPAEPGIRVRIGCVSSVPVRDAAHRACLASDPNLEIVGDDELTYEEEEAVKAKAIAELKKQQADKAAKRK